MSFQAEYKQKFDDLKSAISSENKTQLKRTANGGNTILFQFSPDYENQYIEHAKQLFKEAYFIDISQLFVKYIEEIGWDSFKEFYLEYDISPEKVFRNDNSINLLTLIIKEITSAYDSNKIPFVIRSGALYGTGIDNIHIMEHKAVMEKGMPLVVFYPAKIVDNEVLFLNFKPASKYRCQLIS